MKFSFYKQLSISVMAVSVLGSSANAILRRHDVPDSLYVERGTCYPQVGKIPRHGIATLIAPHWLITAAHVAQGLPRNARAIFGDSVYTIAQTFVHPRWREKGADDIALIRLQEPLLHFAPARVFVEKSEVGKVVTFVGAGKTGTGLTGPKKEDGVFRGATNVVDSVSDAWLYFTFDDSANGTALEGISGPGDSGGPALLERGDQLYVVGVSVWGLPGKRGNGTYGAIEGYTRLSNYVKWIDDTMNSADSAAAVTSSAK